MHELVVARQALTMRRFEPVSGMLVEIRKWIPRSSQQRHWTNIIGTAEFYKHSSRVIMPAWISETKEE
jgi:hypothetical protein